MPSGKVLISNGVCNGKAPISSLFWNKFPKTVIPADPELPQYLETDHRFQREQPFLISNIPLKS
jgi:hypothetical protein